MVSKVIRPGACLSIRQAYDPINVVACPQSRLSLIGVSGRFVQNCTLSCLGQERSRNVAYGAKPADGVAVSPDVIAGQCDVLPSERGDVGEKIIGNGAALSPQMLDDTVEVDGVPVDDRGGKRLRPEARKLWFSKVRSRISP